MSNDNNIFFKPLNDSEKKSKLFQLSNSSFSSYLTIWKKGSTEKHKLLVSDFNREKISLAIEGKTLPELINETLLCTFELNGMHFFGKAKLASNDKTNLFLTFQDTLYKSERRNNFRLLTYPHHEVHININIGEEEIQKSNVLSLNTGQSQTSLFKNFLSIMEDKEEEKPVEFDGFLSFRVLDLSVTGLAFQFGKIEKMFFENININLGVMYLDFNGEIIKIPNAKILYVMDRVSPNQNATLFKAGVQFLDIDINLDEYLAKKINETLRSSEAEFEDFVK